MSRRGPSWWRRVNVPVVIAAAGIAAVISAFVVTILLMGLLIADRDDPPAPVQPSVIDIGWAPTSAPQLHV
ncbi:hypothetical protein V1Y59_03595 [Gordonia sp. PKS22-38]|uniref:Uncharacterized protein n=1 Tax=Gordonia prachuapensis TaxID=3115651 RepID=A0ABU7MPB0_9ACTN|nr:hypothetical protein [Gordonia sp. PKS22-38]